EAPSDEDSAMSSAPASLSPQPLNDIWPCGQCRSSTERAAASARECTRLTDALRDARDQLELMEFRLLELEDASPDKGARDNLTDSDSGCVSPGSRIKDSASPELKRMDSGYKSPHAPSSPCNPRRHLNPHDDFKEDFAKAQFLADILDRNSETTSDSLKSNPVKEHLEQMILNAASAEDRGCLEQVLMLLYNFQALSSSVSEDECFQAKPRRICDLKTRETDIPPQKTQKAIATVTPYNQKGYKSESLESLCEERKPNILQESGIFEGVETESTSTQTEVNDSFECSGELNTEIQRLNSIREKLERQGVRNRTLSTKEDGDGLECRCVKLGKKHKQYYERRLKFLEGKISIYEAAPDVKEAKLAQRLQKEYLLENRIQVSKTFNNTIDTLKGSVCKMGRCNRECVLQELESQLSELQDKYERLEEECCELEEIENDTRLHWQHTTKRHDGAARVFESQGRAPSNELVTRLERLEQAVPALIMWNVVQAVDANITLSGKKEIEEQTANVIQTLEKNIKELEEELNIAKRQIRALLISEQELKCRVAELERRETAYLEMLTQADDMWAEMEGGRVETEIDEYKQYFEPLKKKLKEVEESDSGLRIALEKSERDTKQLQKKNTNLTAACVKAETEAKKFEAELKLLDGKFKKDAAKRKEQCLLGDLDSIRKELTRCCKHSQELEVESLEKQLALTQKTLAQCKRKCDEKIKTMSHELSIKTEELEELRSETMKSFHASRVDLKPERTEYVDEGYSIYTAVPKKTDYGRMHHSMSYITSDTRCSCPSMRSQLVSQLIEDLFDRIHNTVDDDLSRLCQDLATVNFRDITFETKANITNYLLMAISKELVRSIGDADAKTDTENTLSLRLAGNVGVVRGAARLASVSCACAAARLCAARPDLADAVKSCQE
ncbi:PFTAIRE-interacting factor 1A, partial [Operophtera brumata]